MKTTVFTANTLLPLLLLLLHSIIYPLTRHQWHIVYASRLYSELRLLSLTHIHKTHTTQFYYGVSMRY